MAMVHITPQQISHLNHCTLSTFEPALTVTLHALHQLLLMVVLWCFHCCCVTLRQSTFMKLVEAEVLLKAAGAQLRAMEKRHNPQQNPQANKQDVKDRDKWWLSERFEKLQERHGAGGLSTNDYRELKALASPRLLTVWFNSWWVHCQTLVIISRMWGPNRTRWKDAACTLTRGGR